ncbi:MAG: GntR family transcriptional regulator [Chloroflexota bacterium]
MLLNEVALPLHYRIREALRGEIDRSGMKPGDQLPTETELMARFQVSRATIRRGLGDLSREGLLYRRAGKGTFVAERRIELDLNGLTGFVEDMLTVGLKASARVLEIKPIVAPGEAAAKLRLSEGDRVVRIQRVRLADEQPVSLDITYLPERIGARVAQEDLRIHPIFSLLEGHYGIALGAADYRVEAASADRFVARHLDVATGAPILLIERTSYAVDGLPVDYEKLYYRGDKLRYRLTLRRQKPAADLPPASSIDRRGDPSFTLPMEYPVQ